MEYVQKEYNNIPDFENERQKLKDDLSNLLKDENNQAREDTLKTEGCYFNSGCCSFKGGRVTGYEMTGTDLRLVEWYQGDTSPKLLGEGQLGTLFQSITFA